jgi:leucyl-tRNA synthetase
MDYLEKKGWGKRVVRYHLRDWIFSRQHYWGEPIPIIYCHKCWENQKSKIKDQKFKEGTDFTTIDGVEYAINPVEEKDLPVELPEVEKYQPTDTGESPLANIKSWVNVKCPKCGGSAKRETDTMPNWAGSSWYYLRFCDPNNKKAFADRKKMDYWQPVDFYLGGAEHTTLHLLYSRFWHKFLNDLKLVPGKEPYAARRQHGVILGEDGARMSKSKGNVINPIEMVEKFGADTLRLYLMFMGPYDATMAWNTAGIEGMARFVKRLWRLFQISDPKLQISNAKKKKLITLMHQTIKKVTQDIEHFHYNTAIAQIMIFVNFLTENGVNDEALKSLCLLLAPFTPHMAEEVWHGLLGQKDSIHLSEWPRYSQKLVREEVVTIPVQVNGKLRGTLRLSSEQAGNKDEVVKAVRKDEKVAKWLEGKKVKKEIFVEGKLINFVVDQS